MNLASKQYHVDVFEGNSCNTSLKEGGKLLDKEIYENVDKFALIPLFSAFKIVNSYFTLKMN